jgi:hypothetical protein
MTGLVSTSNSRYDPPCRSKPRLIFFEKGKLSLKEFRLSSEKNDKTAKIE